MIDANTKQILARWRTLEEDSGLRQATVISWILGILGALLIAFVVCTSVIHHDPSFTPAAALIAGWVLAERNALRRRLEKWPVFKAYLDWKRVHHDLDDNA